jgi:hypothetical protein
MSAVVKFRIPGLLSVFFLFWAGDPSSFSFRVDGLGFVQVGHVLYQKALA